MDKCLGKYILIGDIMWKTVCVNGSCCITYIYIYIYININMRKFQIFSKMLTIL